MDSSNVLSCKGVWRKRTARLIADTFREICSRIREWCFPIFYVMRYFHNTTRYTYFSSCKMDEKGSEARKPTFVGNSLSRTFYPLVLYIQQKQTSKTKYTITSRLSRCLSCIYFYHTFLIRLQIYKNFIKIFIYFVSSQVNFSVRICFKTIL